MKDLKDKLPVSYLLFTKHGRTDRLTYWTVSIFIWTSFYILFNFLNYSLGYGATWLIYPILFWSLIATGIKRLHDSNKSAHWLWLIAIPVAGPLLLFFILGFRRGSGKANRFGSRPGLAPDYFKNPDCTNNVVTEVTRLYPVTVADVVVPECIDELQSIIRNTKTPISIGGGRFSMGGQTASAGSLHIDMRNLNKVLDFSPETKTIKVEAGIRWCDLQQLADTHDLSLKIMQTYANFTVGGSLSVNCHGRYMGLGPVILSVRSIEVILADGDKVKCTTSENDEIFYATIGCYNALAVIATVEFDLVENIAVKRICKTMPTSEYAGYFNQHMKQDPNVVFHNADLYPPAFRNARAVSWVSTSEKPTKKTRLMPLASAYPVERYFIGAFSMNNFGKWRRQYIIDPIFYLRKVVHWRNYEAGYDVAELEPESRKRSTYVLQEYFVPVEHFNGFLKIMAEIFQRHGVNVINVSVRHSGKDPGSMLAWARAESFAFVVWYKQNTDDAAKEKVKVWTREMINAVISFEGAYYLPYQPHATAEQFHKAYPDAKKLMQLKSNYDPGFKFRNVIWDTYYKP